MAGSQSIPKLFSETLAKMDLVAWAEGRVWRRKMERTLSVLSAAEEIRGLVVEACMFCHPHVPAGHCFLALSCPDLLLLQMSKIVDNTIFFWV